MSQRRDDTTEEPARAPNERARRAPGSYYYDDATGYKPYDPAQDEDGEDDDTGDDPAASANR